MKGVSLLKIGKVEGNEYALAAEFDRKFEFLVYGGWDNNIFICE
jgi:hypothetical protein